jgi:antitoxin HigA-1
MLEMGMQPSHPGEILRYHHMEPLGLTVTETAKGLGVSRNQLSLLLNGRAGVSPEMAVKLSEAFGTSVELWMDLQKQYDIWHAKRTVSRQGIRHFSSRPAM